MNTQASVGSRIQYMNYLNILACFAVICLHCSQVVSSPSQSITWVFSVVMQSVFIFAVPVFFMISGANLLGYQKKYSTGTFFKKRFKKTFGALLFGSILVYSIRCFVPDLFFREPLGFSVFDFVDRFLNCDIEFIYWFFYAILAVYVATPILAPLSESKEKLRYAIIFFAVITVVLPVLGRYTTIFDYYQGFFGAQSFTGGIMYFLLGYYLQNYASIKKRSVYVMLFVICVILMVLATLAINMDALQTPGIPYEGFFAHAFSFLGMGAAVSVFMLLKSGESRFQKMSDHTKGIIQRLSAASLGVYLIHLLVMNQIGYWWPHPWSIAMTIEPPIVYLISVVIVMAAQQVWALARRGLKKKSSSP